MGEAPHRRCGLDIQPRTLLVPPELQHTAKTLLASEYLRQSVDNTPTGNAMRNIVSLETEPRLSNADRFMKASALAWYLFVSVADMPMIVAFLQGKQLPTVEYFGLDARHGHGRSQRRFGAVVRGVLPLRRMRFDGR